MITQQIATTLMAALSDFEALAAQGDGDRTLLAATARRWVRGLEAIYCIDWSQAPDWAVAHVYMHTGFGYYLDKVPATRVSPPNKIDPEESNWEVTLDYPMDTRIASSGRRLIGVAFEPHQTLVLREI